MAHRSYKAVSFEAKLAQKSVSCHQINTAFWHAHIPYIGFWLFMRNAMAHRSYKAVNFEAKLAQKSVNCHHFNTAFWHAHKPYIVCWCGFCAMQWPIGLIRQGPQGVQANPLFPLNTFKKVGWAVAKSGQI